MLKKWMLLIALSLAAACGPASNAATTVAPTEAAVIPETSTKPVETAPLEPPDLSKVNGVTFGDGPDCALLAGEQVAAIFDQQVSDIDAQAGLGCTYDDQYGFNLLSVYFASGAGLKCTDDDGTYLGSPVDEVAELGERATWSETAGSLCVLQGDSRFQILPTSSSPFYADDKSLAIDLAQIAISRLP